MKKSDSVSQSLQNNLAMLIERYGILLMGLHDGIGYEGGRHFSATEPSSVETLHSFLSAFDSIKLDVDLALSMFKKC